MPIPNHHSCDHIKARNRLIPEAEKIANEKVRGNSPNKAGNWTKIFAETMDRLAMPLLNGK